MKVKITEGFRYEGEKYEKGREAELPESVAQSVIEKGYGKKVSGTVEEIGETPEGEPREPEPGERKGKGPEWKKKIWISEDRNLEIAVWPPREGGKFDSPSVTIQESRKDDSGNWRSNNIYLPTGSSLLALSEHMRGAWKQVQELRSELEQGS